MTGWSFDEGVGVDYSKLVHQFGCEMIDASLIRRFEAVTNQQAHPWLRRGIFFSHKDLNLLLDAYERGEEIYLYTGRGPSSESMHLGHMAPFMFTKYLQDALNAIVVIQMSDDEKYYFREGLSLEHTNRLTRENAKDIIACGFHPDKTWIFSNLESVGGSLYRNVVRLMRHTSGNLIHGIYGLDLNNSVGQLSWPCFQAAPAFSTSFTQIFGDRQLFCLVPMGIDQYPYFRLARELAVKIGGKKPATIHSRFLPSLENAHDKASSTGSKEVLFLSNSRSEIEKKVRQKAFSGGGMTKKEQTEKGANLFIDVPYHYLIYFLDDDLELKKIATEYRSGRMMSSEIKNKMIEVVWTVIERHQQARAGVTPEVIAHFMNPLKSFDRRPTPGKKPLSAFSEDPIGIAFDPYFRQ